jgi:hypothetical protein
MPIEDTFFREQMARLEGAFNRGMELASSTQSEYFTVLRNFRKEDIVRVVDIIIKTYQPDKNMPWFPSVSVVLDTLNELLQSRGHEESSFQACPKCDGYGRYIRADGGQGQEVFCDCPKGLKMREARHAYIEAHGRGYHTRPDIPQPTMNPLRSKDRGREPGGDEEEVVPF